MVQCTERAGVLGTVCRQAGKVRQFHDGLFMAERGFGGRHDAVPAGSERPILLRGQRVYLPEQLLARVPQGSAERRCRFGVNVRVHDRSLKA